MVPPESHFSEKGGRGGGLDLQPFTRLLDDHRL